MPSNTMKIRSETNKRIQAAIEILPEYDLVSPSLLQRRLAISYYQGVRLMKHLERIGVVGTSRGKQPRKVLLNKN